MIGLPKILIMEINKAVCIMKENTVLGDIYIEVSINFPPLGPQDHLS